ncbi:unnamed protein product [Lactuca virosa]|uniref:Uncharacterized protein n=1 Tax=Lactuca virosa TaxID=75947 RepID=A0AAU9MLP7_9ASTR|nr:unnamed protein product [Lactuca virosa]
MRKIHSVRKSSRKKLKYHDAEADVLGSFHFEDSPQKEEEVAGSRNTHGDSEFVESSSSSTAFCVSNHNNKGLFFSNSPVHVSKEASCEPSVEKGDCCTHENEEVAGPIHVSGKERVPENSDAEDLVCVLPSTGIFSPIVTTPTPPSGSAADEPSSLPLLTLEKRDDQVSLPRFSNGGAVDAFGCFTPPLNLQSPPSSVVSSTNGKDSLSVEGRTLFPVVLLHGNGKSSA